MHILLMQELAKDKQQALDLFGEDWKSKIEQIPAMVAMVKGWQDDIFARFGEPRVHDKNNHRGWLDVSPGQLLPIEDVNMDNVRFDGATVLQGLSLELDKEEKATISYKAMLFTDENYFLRKMLPKTVEIPLHDPAYDLLNVIIEVPRSQLVKESIFALGDIMDQKEHIALRKMKKAGRVAGRHKTALGIVAAGGSFTGGIHALANYFSSLPPPAPPTLAPEASAAIATTTTPDLLNMFGSIAGIPVMLLLFPIVMFMMIRLFK